MHVKCLVEKVSRTQAGLSGLSLGQLIDQGHKGCSSVRAVRIDGSIQTGL